MKLKPTLWNWWVAPNDQLLGPKPTIFMVNRTKNITKSWCNITSRILTFYKGSMIVNSRIYFYVWFVWHFKIWVYPPQWNHAFDNSCNTVWRQVIIWTMLSYCGLAPTEHISVKFYLKFDNFRSRKCIRRLCLQNYCHFVSAPMYKHWNWLITSNKIHCLLWVCNFYGNQNLLDHYHAVNSAVGGTYHRF